MIVLVVTDSSQPAHLNVLRPMLDATPGAEIVTADVSLRPAGGAGDRVVAAADADLDGLAWLDAALALDDEARRWSGAMAAAAAVVGDEPVVVLDERAHVSGDLGALVEGVDGVGLLPVVWRGGCALGWAPGLMVLAGPGAADALAALGRQVADLIRSGDRRVRPWDVASGGPSVQPLIQDGCRLGPDTLRADAGLAERLGSGAPWEAGGTTVVRFAGFDPTEPWWYPDLTAGSDESPSVSLVDLAGLARLARSHADALLAAGWRPHGGIDVFPGVRWHEGLRREWAQALAGTGAPPNPARPGDAAGFVRWLTSEPGGDRSGTVVARAVATLRPDVAELLSGGAGLSSPGVVDWAWRHGMHEGVVPLVGAPPLRTSSVVHRVAEPRPGVELVGYHSSEAGLGVAVRRVARALDAASIPWAAYSSSLTSSRQRAAAVPTDPTGPYRVQLVLINPDQLPRFVAQVGSSFFDHRHTVGLWYWETDVLTDVHRNAMGLVDEIWGATRYLTDVFAAEATVPVHHVPVPLEFDQPQRGPEVRARLGLDDRFTVLFSFDFLSVVERKNPLGLVEAFRRAFPRAGEARLILKSINGDLFPKEAERIRAAVADRPDIDCMDGYLDGADRLSLVAEASCYASLHRSEGLGMTMAEAMAVGTPVVATAYSGNLDFMDDGSAMLVPAREVLIGPGLLYPAEGHWADPDLDAAAAALRRLCDQPELAADLAANARRALEPFSAEAVGRAIAARLERIGGTGGR